MNTPAVEYSPPPVQAPCYRRFDAYPARRAASSACAFASRIARSMYLYKSGNRRAYRMSARDIEEVWRSMQPPEEGNVEDYPVEGA